MSNEKFPKAAISAAPCDVDPASIELEENKITPKSSVIRVKLLIV
jgi:hypothetical protein